ncbi:MAG TPA: hypothetical protein VHY34_03480 [Caulobacteraceae bacterium]|nr:hypothetical protein [Caulobacteraceae bacterium]
MGAAGVQRCKPWFAHEWLAEVLLGGAFNLAGWAGLALVIALAAGLSVGLLARHVGVG